MRQVIEEAKSIFESGDESRIAETILRLDEEVSPTISKEVLSTTKIGHDITKLKTHKNPDIAARARMLIEKWKVLVKGSATLDKPVDSTPAASSEDMKHQEADEGSEGSRKRPLEASPSTELEPVLNGVDYASTYSGKYVKNEKRNKCREILFKAFVEGFDQSQLTMVDKHQLETLIVDIENTLWEHHVTKNNSQAEYAAQLRSIKSNLSDKKNPEFNSAIYMGGISVDALAVMSSVDMASDAKKQERRKAQKDALEACQSDWDLRNVKRAKGQFPCGKCKSDNTTYFQMQTRSSDEPMTT